MAEHRSYYAIIPANVRYDSNLIPSAKLLYGEITALCNEKGYCWASNEYFSNQYDVSKATIQNWLKSLEEKGYIYREVKYKDGSKEIEARKIHITNRPMQEKLVGSPRKIGGGHQEKLATPHQEIYQDNNTSFNTTINNTKEYKEELPASKKSKPTRHKYGEYKNVLLIDSDLEKLKQEFPNDWEQRIERLSEYCASTGKVYKNYLATIRNWAKRDSQKQPQQVKPRNNYGKPIKQEVVPQWLKEEQTKDHDEARSELSPEMQARFDSYMARKAEQNEDDNA